MFILIDIGGTKTRIVGSKDLESFSTEKIKFDTPQDFDEWIEMITGKIFELVGNDKIEAVAGGIPGEFGEDHDTIRSSPNMSSWVGRKVITALKEKLDCPVFLRNDSMMAGLGEATHGAGKGYRIVSYVTVSTGVGGSRVIDGAIDEASVGFEPGQQIIDIDNSICPECKVPSTLEHLVSGTALKHRFGIEPYEVRDPKVWEELSLWLGYGLSNSILHWSPDILVLGGSMIVGDPAISVDRIRFHIESALKIFPKIPDIEKSELGDENGLYGSMEYLKSQI